MAHRPDGYRWDEVFTRMIVEALGIKRAWTKRLTPQEGCISKEESARRFEELWLRAKKQISRVEPQAWIL